MSLDQGEEVAQGSSEEMPEKRKEMAPLLASVGRCPLKARDYVFYFYLCFNQF